MSTSTSAVTDDLDLNTLTITGKVEVAYHGINVEDAIISKYDTGFEVYPTELVKHLAVYGPRDPTYLGDPKYLGLKCPGTHYRTTRGILINFFVNEGVRRNIKIKDAFALEFDDEKARYHCRWNSLTKQVDVTLAQRPTDSITIVLDTLQ